MIRRPVLIALTWAFALTTSHGHGITATRVDGGIGVRAVYDDGTPVSFSDASLFAPAADEKPILTGLTDRNGCFLFRPDTQGVWKVTVDDGMGHAVTRELPFDGQAMASAPGVARMPKRYGVLAGLSAIFGIFGWAAFLRLKRTDRTGE